MRAGREEITRFGDTRPMTLQGSCHCGNLQVDFETEVALAALPLRACQCSFCRKLGVRATSDPAGRLRFQVREPALLSRSAGSRAGGRPSSSSRAEGPYL